MTPTQPLAFLFDATRCIDCRACMVACSAENNVPMDNTRIWLSGAASGDISRPATRHHALPLHALPGTGLRFGLSGGGMDQARGRTGGLRQPAASAAATA